jgi:hypothetical protein
MSMVGSAFAVVTGRGSVLEILDAVVMDAVQDGVEAGGDPVDVLERDVALVELAVGEDPVDQVLDLPFDPAGGRVFQGPGGGFDHVREHHQGGFAGLGLGSRVTEIILLHLVFTLLPSRGLASISAAAASAMEPTITEW